MKSGKLILAGFASALLMSAAMPSFAQQADNAPAAGPRGPAGIIFNTFDANHDGKITRDEENAEKAKIFAEIDKNGDKKLSYDEVKAWSKDVMSKMPMPGQDAKGGPDAPPPPPGDDKAADAEKMPMPGGPDGMGGPGMDHHGKKHHGMNRHGGHDGMMGPMGGPRERLAQMFLRADANDDGFISEDEFNVFADQMFTRMDRNGDGVIDMRDMPRHGSMGGRHHQHHGDHKGMNQKR
jgi:hypothetical protein